MCGITMEFVPARAVSFLSTQSFVIFVPGTKVEDQVTIKIELDKRKFAIATLLRRFKLR